MSKRFSECSANTESLLATPQLNCTYGQYRQRICNCYVATHVKHSITSIALIEDGNLTKEKVQ